ncbi:MAG: hypothetical protein ACK55Z_03500, partial [bacterium]
MCSASTCLSAYAMAAACACAGAEGRTAQLERGLAAAWAEGQKAAHLPAVKEGAGAGQAEAVDPVVSGEPLLHLRPYCTARAHAHAS